MTTSSCQEEGCLEPTLGRLCYAHRDIAQTDFCYVILRVGKRKGTTVRNAHQETVYAVAMCLNKLLPGNVAIRNHMIKLYPTPTQRGMLKQWFGWLARRITPPSAYSAGSVA